MGADLAEGQDAGLGKGGRAAAAARAAEDAGVGQAVRDIDDEAVQGHQPQPLIEGPRGLGRGLEFDHLLRQVEQGSRPEPLAGLAEGRTPRRALAAEGLQPLEDLAVAVAAEQSQGDDEPDHEPGGQPQVAAAGMAGAAQDGLDAGRGRMRLRARRRSVLGHCASVAASVYKEVRGVSLPVKDL